MSRTTQRLLTLAVAGAFAVGVAGSAFVDTQWQKIHPRREQVNNRLQRQNVRIHNEALVRECRDYPDFASHQCGLTLSDVAATQ